MDLLTSTEKTAISAVFDNLHDTFKRSVKVFTKTLASYTGISANHNALFGTNKTQNPTEPAATVTTILARVKFMDKSEVGKIPGLNTGSNLSLPEGTIRLKVSDDDYALLRKAVKIEYGGLSYVLHSDAGKIGPFDVNYYTLYFSRADT